MAKYQYQYLGDPQLHLPGIPKGLGPRVSILSSQPETAPESPQATPKRPATTPHASHAMTHTSTAAMGWENARPDRPPPAPRGAHFPTPWPLWRCVSWRGWRGVWWRVFWGWFGRVRWLFWIGLGMLRRLDVAPFGIIWGPSGAQIHRIRDTGKYVGDTLGVGAYGIVFERTMVSWIGGVDLRS